MITKLIHCLVGVFLCTALVSGVSSAETSRCKPTPPDSLGPFYEPNAPLRASVGEGYVLTGEVKAAQDCSPIAGARIELWLAGYPFFVIPRRPGSSIFEPLQDIWIPAFAGMTTFYDVINIGGTVRTKSPV